MWIITLQLKLSYHDIIIIIMTLNQMGIALRRSKSMGIIENFSFHFDNFLTLNLLN